MKNKADERINTIKEAISKFSFGDVEGYKSIDEGISYRIIVMNQLQKISKNVNCEFRGGYWETKVVPMQGGIDKTTETYVPDTREVYSNSVEFLHDLLLPHFLKEDSDKWAEARKKMREASTEYNDKIKELMDEYMEDGKFTDEEKLEFKEKKVLLCRKLFQQLSIYLDAINYLSSESN